MPQTLDATTDNQPDARVSDMATRDDAHDGLQQLAADESAVRYPPLPAWFFAAMAAIVAALCLAPLLPSGSAQSSSRLALTVLAVVLAGRWWWREGVAGVRVPVRDMAGFLALLVGVQLVALGAASGLDAGWPWVVAAVVSAAVVLATGRRYRQETGRAA
jgi:hypothetical protein